MVSEYLVQVIGKIMDYIISFYGFHTTVIFMMLAIPRGFAIMVLGGWRNW